MAAGTGEALPGGACQLAAHQHLHAACGHRLGQEDPDLTVRDLPVRCRCTDAALRPSRLRSPETRSHRRSAPGPERAQPERPRTGAAHHRRRPHPTGRVQQSPHHVRHRVSGELCQRPPVLAFQPRHQVKKDRNAPGATAPSGRTPGPPPARTCHQATRPLNGGQSPQSRAPRPQRDSKDSHSPMITKRPCSRHTAMPGILTKCCCRTSEAAVSIRSLHVSQAFRQCFGSNHDGFRILRLCFLGFLACTVTVRDEQHIGRRSEMPTMSMALAGISKISER